MNLVRLHNPSPERKRERRLVRLHNPGIFEKFFGTVKKKGAAAKEAFESFRGKPSKAVRVFEAAPGTPKDVYELGGLRELTLDAATAKRKTLRALGFEPKKNEWGELVLDFNPALVKLAADPEEDLHIVGFYRELPRGLRAGRSYHLGDVAAATYRGDKRHIKGGESAKQEWEHEFAEHGGGAPGLYFKDNHLFFRDGTYGITPEGITG